MAITVELRNLRAVREAFGWSIDDLCRAVNVGNLTVTSMERPVPLGPNSTDEAMAQRIVDALGSTREACGWAEKPNC